MITYRTFRNTDPPGLVRVWNDAMGGRGTVPLRSATVLEYFILSKSYFDPAALQVALSNGEVIGWALSGFGPDPTRRALDFRRGVICVLGVLPEFRGKGVGTGLLRRSEDYLRAKGAETVLAGPLAPDNPYTFGVYGGAQSPGFLESNPGIGPFLARRGYEVSDTVQVLQRHLDRPFNVIDGRFPLLRRRFEVKTRPKGPVAPWYDECVQGPLEFLSFQAEERGTGRPVGSARIWEMEPFSFRWNESVVGLLDVEIHESVRRQGVARLVLGNIMRYLHDQYFTLVEAHLAPDNLPAAGLLHGLGFQKVDVGIRYRLRA